VQIFATVGGLLVSLCIFAGGIAATSFSTGVFAEQFGNVLGANNYKSVSNGLKSGAIIGVFWSVAAIYELGNWGALLSILGLCACLLLVAGLTRLIADSRRPYNPEFD
jgi:hypothetical protein